MSLIPRRKFSPFNKIRSGVTLLASFALDKGLFHHNYRKLVIVTSGRTGSTMLIDCLNQHPQIQMYYEVFSRDAEAPSPHWRWLLLEKPIIYLNYRIYKYYPPRIQIVGFKIHYYHCQDSKRLIVWDYLSKEADKVIHLKRDLVETYISGMLANKYQTWHVYENEKLNYIHDAHLKIDPVELQSYLKSETTDREHFDQLFGKKDVLEVWYKNLNENHSEELNRIQKWLGVQPIELHPVSLKQNTRRLDEIISNYDELKNYFAKTEWASSIS